MISVTQIPRRTHHAGLRQRVARGFTLLELLLVVGVISFALIAAGDYFRRQVEARLARSAGEQIEIIASAVNLYIAQNTAALSLAASTDINLATLQAPASCGVTACLAAGINEPNPFGSNYNITITRVGPAAPFRFEALIITANPWQIDGLTRLDLVGLAAGDAGVGGGVSYTTAALCAPLATPCAGGANGGWAQPAATYPTITAEGQLAYFISDALGNSLDAIYLRRDGTLPMTGNLNMGANSVNNTNQVNAAGNITTTAGNITATAGNVAGVTANFTDVNATNNVVATNQLQAAAGRFVVNDAGNGARITTTGANGLNVVVENNNGNLRHLNNTGTEINTLSQAGVTTIASGGDLVIQGMNLTRGADAPTTGSVATLLPRLVEINSFIVSDGDAVPVPTCPNSGAPRVFVIPQNASGTVAVTGTWGYNIFASGPIGGPWTAVVRDSLGAPLVAQQALARTFCTY